MFERDQFLHWLRKLNLTERAACAVQQIRSSNPARLVQSGRGNVSGRYPSRKMGVTIQFESHKNELARIQELEYASDVIEFYDQPPSIKLEYQSAAGKKLGVLHTPDFFVIRETSAGWEECKMEEELDRLAEKNPNRYCCDEIGRWRCPPGETYAAQFGLYYQVVSSAGINWIWQRNIIFLDDYLRADLPMVSESVSTAARLLLANNPRLTLEELFGKTEGIATRDDWYQMIACGDVYVDLHAVSLSDHRRAHPALSQSPREAYAAGMAHSGQRLHRLIPYDADFRIFTFPTTSKGTAMVVPGLGVKINSIYYWNDSFRSPDVERTRVEAR